MDLWALLGSSFLAATILPFASEVPLVLIVQRRGEVLVPVIVATLGNYLGACTTYALARGATARLASVPDSRPPRALAIYERYGAPALLLSWVPVIGDAFVALAGAARVRFLTFSLWTFAGKAARYAAVAWLARNV
jgi:membrane protein YqaA with SNARE-associated domain